MIFRVMAKEMSDTEVKRCLAILVEEGVLLDIKRDFIQNAIDITFRILGDNQQKEYSMSLLPNSVEEVSEGVSLRMNGEYIYMQYLVAKGYSQYWQGNMFVDE